MGSKSNLVALAVVFLAGLLVGGYLRHDGGGMSAVAQPARAAGAGGVFAFTGQIDRENYGIIMVDVDSGTLWVYQLGRFGERGGKEQLKLVAARSWLYDRYLEDFNCASPTPTEVGDIISNQQKQQQSPPGPGAAVKPAEPAGTGK